MELPPEIQEVLHRLAEAGFPQEALEEAAARLAAAAPSLEGLQGFARSLETWLGPEGMAHIDTVLSICIAFGVEPSKAYAPLVMHQEQPVSAFGFFPPAGGHFVVTVRLEKGVESPASLGAEMAHAVEMAARFPSGKCETEKVSVELPDDPIGRQAALIGMREVSRHPQEVVSFLRASHMQAIRDLEKGVTDDALAQLLLG